MAGSKRVPFPPGPASCRVRSLEEQREGNVPRNTVVGEVSKLAGVKAATIRYYEGIGMLPVPMRTEGNHRMYAP